MLAKGLELHTPIPGQRFLPVKIERIGVVSCEKPVGWWAQMRQLIRNTLMSMALAV